MINLYRLTDAILWSIDRREFQIKNFDKSITKLLDQIKQHYVLNTDEITRLNDMDREILSIVKLHRIDVDDHHNPLNRYFDEISAILQEAETNIL